MGSKKKQEDLTIKINKALEKATKKVIAEEKARNGYLVIADKNGVIKKIPASEL